MSGTGCTPESPAKNKAESPFGFDISQGTVHFAKTHSDLGENYAIETGAVDFDIVEGSLLISNFSLDPKQTPEEFSVIAPFETDHFDVSVRQVSLKGINLPVLARDLAINIESISIDGLRLDVYRDKWLEDPEFKFKPLPTQVIRDFRFPLWIDHLTLNDSYVRYRQLGDLVEYDDPSPGEIIFDEVNVTSSNITNDRNWLSQYPDLVIDAKTKFMGKYNLTAQYRFHILDTTEAFQAKGEMKGVPSADLYPILHPLMLADIPEAMIHAISFDMTGNDEMITGTLEMEYENLYINVSKTKKQNKSNAFWNTVSNSLIRHNNSRSRGRFVIGLVNAERKKNKSVFNYTWQGLKTGIISTVIPLAKNAGKEKRSNRPTGEKE